MRKPRARRFTLAKRDAAYDAIMDALNDPTLGLLWPDRADLERARSVLTALTPKLR